jgi:hypothetical protein
VSSRVRHPLKSLVLFLALCGAGVWVWENRGSLRSDASTLLPEEKKEEILERIRAAVETENCYVAMRGTLNWRPNEQRYRLDITVMENCESQAKRLCNEIAQLIRSEAEVAATVIAYDDTGREVAREVL